jgi:hypothetical protein
VIAWFPDTMEETVMPTRKKTTTAKKTAAIKNGPLPPYGIAIRQAIARGDLAEMKKVAAQARKHISDVTTALAALEKKLGASSDLKRK